MKKVIRLTESDLMRIVKRVINESKYGSFDDNEWYDKDDKFTRVDDMGDDFDEEEFDDFDEFDSKHGHDTKWFGKGDRGRETFNLYKDKSKRPFKVRTRRGIDEQIKPISNTRPTTCPELQKLSVGRFDRFGLNLVKNELFPASEKTKGDDYAYVELYNGKVCYCQVGKNYGGPSPKQSWSESTDPKQKSAIINHLKNADFMGSYQDDKNPWKKSSGGTYTR